MNKALTTVFFLFLLASVTCAADVIKSFSFQTLDGRTINYKAANGTPMVINIGTHW